VRSCRLVIGRESTRATADYPTKGFELAPEERLRQLERQAAEMRRLVIAGARSRGELP